MPRLRRTTVPYALPIDQLFEVMGCARWPVLSPTLLPAYSALGPAPWCADEREAARSARGEGATANTFNPWGKRCIEQLEAVERSEAPQRTP